MGHLRRAGASPRRRSSHAPPHPSARALEITIPSPRHELWKTVLGRLFEAWADERGVDVDGCGAATFRKKIEERGLEPGACYGLGVMGEVPDIAIEVIESRPLLDKLEVSRGLASARSGSGGRTVGRCTCSLGASYVTSERSALLPALDFAELASFVSEKPPSASVRAYRAALRARG